MLNQTSRILTTEAMNSDRLPLTTQIEARIHELSENDQLSLDEIFDTVCQEYNLNAHAIAQEFDCKCPFALIGFLKALEPADFSNYSMLSTIDTHSL